MRVVILLLAVLLAGCLKAPSASLVGRWTGEYPKEEGISGAFVTEYRKDGTFTTEAAVSAEGRSVTITERGKWWIEETDGRTYLYVRSEEISDPAGTRKADSEEPLRGELKLEGGKASWLVVEGNEATLITMTRAGE